MAQLTSDIVWLVEQDITLADGSTTKALVPQLYVRVQEGELQAEGALIAGNSVSLALTGDLTNSGTIAGRTVVALTADNIHHLSGRITGQNVDMAARTDLNNLGGIIDANHSLIAAAGRDLNLVTSTRSNAQGSRTNIDRIAGLYVTATGSTGTLLVSAGRDANLIAAAIAHQGSGATTITAGHDLNLGTVGESASNRILWDNDNYRNDANRSDSGSTLQTQGDLRLQAQHDIHATAANVTSSQGHLVVTAGNDVQLTAGQANVQLDEAHRFVDDGLFSTTTTSTRDTLDQTTAQATTFSGKTTTVLAGRDINLTGSNVVSDNATTLYAQNNLHMEAATNTRTERHFREEEKSGLFGSGGIGFTIGTQQQNQDNRDTHRKAAASTVGSIHGNVVLGAGKHYQQVGSKVLAPQGNIAIQAQQVDILAAQETSHSTQETQFAQSGLTVAVTAPVIAAIQTAQQMGRAADQTSNTRMKALAGATALMAGKKAVDAGKAIAANPKSGGGLSVSITVGGASSESNTTQDSSTAASSHITAGGNVHIQASGAGRDSRLTVQGSHIKGDGNVTLKADGDIQLLAAQNTRQLQRSSSSMSGGVGVAISLGSNGAAFGVTANASASHGDGNGSDVSQTNTHVVAGNTLTLASGGDTRLRGAVAQGKQVTADVGGDLSIESLQDTSTYKSRDQSIGGSVTAGFGFSASVSASQQKIDSDFASVTEQSSIKAGDGGFKVKVANDTDLKGGAITSTQQAIDDNKNSFNTGGTLTTGDMQNKASYQASSVSVGIGMGEGFGGSAGRGNDSDNASSTTQAAISGIAGNKEARTGDVESGIETIFDADKVAKEINAQALITQEFGREAGEIVSNYAQSQRKRLQEQLEKTSEDTEKQTLQTQINEVNLQERIMNVLVGAVTGLGGAALTKESLSAAADQMRQIMIEDSKKFAGITDGETVLSNISGPSDGVRGDGAKIGGVRVDLDVLCGTTNERCKTDLNHNLELDANGQITFLPDKAGGRSLAQYIQSSDAQEMIGPTGGVQGAKGSLFAVPYKAGSWQDRLIEAFSGTHDMIGGKASGLYDSQGNIKRGVSEPERQAYEKWSIVAIVPAAPFAFAEVLPPGVWKAISILLGVGR